ncbi:ribbon-helix-helix protein, CopG family [Rhodococcus sp. NPDC058521]|uniref:ribbon-helix-helix protein, CopG family n=1 Tax=Rhodococcus sp. NPDC058521 TaxID=3346536 RepID=UPI003668C56E
MSSNDKNTDYDELSQWAERDMTLPMESDAAERGDDAAAAGRALLERVGVGRPSLARDAGISGASPKRQVRLPRPLSNKLDELAERQDRKPSELMREAVEEYVQKHTA